MTDKTKPVITLAFKYGEGYSCDKDNYFRDLIVVETGDIIGQVEAERFGDAPDDIQYRATDSRFKDTGTYYNINDLAIELLKRHFHRGDCSLVSVGVFDATPIKRREW